MSLINEETGLEVIATRCEFNHGVSTWVGYFDKHDPLPTTWEDFDNQPQGVMQLVALTDVQVLLAKKDQEIERMTKALQAIASPTQIDNLLWWQIEARKALAEKD